MIHTRYSSVLALTLSIATVFVGGCTTEHESEVASPISNEETAALQDPPKDVQSFAAALEKCAPTFGDDLEAYTNGESPSEPVLDSSCQVESQARSGCFSRAWSQMNWRERSACVAVGLPICWTIFCSGII